jgi:hypothetical protein
LTSGLILAFPGLQEFILLERAFRHSLIVLHELIEKLIKWIRWSTHRANAKA